MALFKENKNESQAQVKKITSSSTFISQDIEVTGNFKGEGSLQVEGTLHGDIQVTSVVIGESGKVIGEIKAKNVIINGNLKGSIQCDSLEVMKNGSISNIIDVKNLKVTGEVEGKVTVSNLLEIEKTGYVHGEIILNKIITEEGGRIMGSMQQYKEAIKKESIKDEEKE